jgi:hypothetical protein
MDVDEILNILQTQLEIFQLLTQTHDFGQKFFGRVGLHSQRFLQDLSDQFDKLSPNSILKHFLRVDLYHSDEVGLHIQDGFSKE